jgi:hypothetical protein
VEQPVARAGNEPDGDVPEFASNVPALVARHFVDRREPLDEPESERFPATVLSADISGFTALTERLAGTGPNGRIDGHGLPPWSRYSFVLLFTWRVIPENHRRVMGVRISDQDTRAARAVDWVGASGLVGSEHAGDPCCRQQRPGELCVRPRVEPANLDHVPARFGWVLTAR